MPYICERRDSLVVVTGSLPRTARRAGRGAASRGGESFARTILGPAALRSSLSLRLPCARSDARMASRLSCVCVLCRCYAVGMRRHSIYVHVPPEPGPAPPVRLPRVTESETPMGVASPRRVRFRSRLGSSQRLAIVWASFSMSRHVRSSLN